MDLTCSNSRVRWRREERPSRCEMTRKPRPAITCCCIEGDVSTNSQMKLISFEQSDWWEFNRKHFGLSFSLKITSDAIFILGFWD